MSEAIKASTTTLKEKHWRDYVESEPTFKSNQELVAGLEKVSLTIPMQPNGA